MRILQELRRRGRQIAPQVIFACVFGYFVYHAVQGDRGFLAKLRLEQELERARAARAELAVQEAKLAHKVSRLQLDNIDPDLLDEQARRLLGYGRPDDLVIMLPGQSSAVED